MCVWLWRLFSDLGCIGRSSCRISSTSFFMFGQISYYSEKQRVCFGTIIFQVNLPKSIWLVKDEISFVLKVDFNTRAAFKQMKYSWKNELFHCIGRDTRIISLKVYAESAFKNATLLFVIFQTWITFEHFWAKNVQDILQYELHFWINVLKKECAGKRSNYSRIGKYNKKCTIICAAWEHRLALMEVI